MKDQVNALNGFLEVVYRSGKVEIAAVSDIKSVQSRSEGGTSIRLLNDRVILLGVQIKDVREALRIANGGLHATS